MADPFKGWRLLLSHHLEVEAHHCLRLGSVALCTRCLGLYPALVGIVLWEGAWGPFFRPLRWFVSISLVIPAVIDWANARLHAARGSNITRGITGILAGIGLGIAFSDFFRDSNLAYFWALLGSLTAVVLLIWRASPSR